MVSLFFVGPVAVRALVSFSGRFVGTPSVVRAVFCEMFGELVRWICGLLLLSFILVKTLWDSAVVSPFLHVGQV